MNSLYVNRSNASDTPHQNSVEMIKSFVILMNIFIIVLGATLNTCVLLAAATRKRLHSEIEACHSAIMHLCIASLLIAVVSLPINTIWQITFEWKAGTVGCKLFMSARVVGFYMASFTITYLCICRCAIILPIPRIITEFSSLLIAAQWAAALLASSVQSFAFHLVQFSEISQCVVMDESDGDVLFQKAYTIAHCVVCYVMPSATIVVTQAILHRQLHCGKAAVAVSASFSARPPPRPEPELSDYYDTRQTYALATLKESSESPQSKAKAKTKAKVKNRSRQSCISGARKAALKVSLLTISAYAVCWTPHYVSMIWKWFSPESAAAIHPIVHAALTACAQLNCVINPIIYGMLTTSIRKRMTNTLRCICSFCKYVWPLLVGLVAVPMCFSVVLVIGLGYQANNSSETKLEASFVS